MKRILSILLAALMILPLAACGNSREDGGGTQSSTSAVTEAETADMSLVCELPEDLNYKGADVTLIYRKKAGVADEFDITEPSAVLVENAVYERNQAVESRLGVTLHFIPNESVEAAHAKDISAGYRAGESFEIITNSTHLEVSPVINGQFRNLNIIDNIDTTKKYWAQGYNKLSTFTEENKQYLASGAIAISMFRYMFITLYNKDLFVNNSIPDLYDTVMNGEWTLDKQFEILTGRYVDSDGNGRKSMDDSYGLLTGVQVSMDPYPTACGIHIVDKDPETKDWYFNGDTIERLATLSEKLNRIVSSESTYMYPATYDDVGQNGIVEGFAKNKSLMCTALIYSLESCIGEISFNYGVAPIPKLDVAQKSYGTYVQDQVTATGISAVVPDDRLEMIGAVLECMAYYSYNTVRSAYYEQALSLRYMNDPQSREIMGLIYDCLDFDFVGAASGLLSAGLRGTLRSVLSSGRGNASSSIKKAQKSVENDLKRINKHIMDME